MIEVLFYEKTESPCPVCDRMSQVLEDWIEKNPNKEVSVNYLSAEEHGAYLRDMGFRSAPVISVRRSKNSSEDWTSGRNEDVLVDILEGNTSLWDD